MENDRALSGSAGSVQRVSVDEQQQDKKASRKNTMWRRIRSIHEDAWWNDQKDERKRNEPKRLFRVLTINKRKRQTIKTKGSDISLLQKEALSRRKSGREGEDGYNMSKDMCPIKRRQTMNRLSSGIPRFQPWEDVKKHFQCREEHLVFMAIPTFSACISASGFPDAS